VYIQFVTRSCARKMASKRKPSKRVMLDLSRIMTKRIKVEDIVLNTYTLHHVLPKLSKEDFVTYMLEKGPVEWKQTTDSVTSFDAKKLIIMIMSNFSLMPAFAAYLTLLEMDENAAMFMYELGLGDLFQGDHKLDSPRIRFYNQTKGEPMECNIYPILPTLMQTPERGWITNKHMVMNEVTKTQTRINLSTLGLEDIYYKKLTSAHTCAKLQRWSECFAFSLSALDDHQQGMSNLHDCFCLMALSGSKMSVSLEWCCKVLEEARVCVAKSIEHTWHRVTTFQSCLRDNGFFELEKEVYEKSLPLFVHNLPCGQKIKFNHLLALLNHIENNLAFQYGRQTFHSECENFCEKPPCLDQSFEATSRLLGEMDSLAQSMMAPGTKEYFRGYYYLYSTMKDVYANERCETNLTLATALFQLAKDQMQPTNPLHLDVCLMLSFLKKVPLSIHSINVHFSKKTMVRNTTGASHFYFRAMLITMYWDNRFQPFPTHMLISNANDAELKATVNCGYRLKLLTALIRGMDATFIHEPNKDVADHPVLTLSAEQERCLKKAKHYWRREEEDDTFQPIQQQLPRQQQNHSCKTPVTAYQILELHHSAQDLYAFGAHIVKCWTKD
jgi:hypothetical protein